MCLHRSPTTLWPVASNKMRLDKSYKINSDKYHTGDLVQGVQRKSREYAVENCLFNPSSNSGFHNGHPGKWYIPLILYSMLVKLKYTYFTGLELQSMFLETVSEPELWLISAKGS